MLKQEGHQIIIKRETLSLISEMVNRSNRETP